MGLGLVQNELLGQVWNSFYFCYSELHSKVWFVLCDELSIAKLGTFFYFLEVAKFELSEVKIWHE